MDVLNYAPGIGCLGQEWKPDVPSAIASMIIFLIGNEHSTTVNSAMCAVNVSLAVGLALCGFSGASGATAKEFIKDRRMQLKMLSRLDLECWRASCWRAQLLHKA